jgi:hypothetical protein
MPPADDEDARTCWLTYAFNAAGISSDLKTEADTCVRVCGSGGLSGSGVRYYGVSVEQQKQTTTARERERERAREKETTTYLLLLLLLSI